jgi:hypothetical protein
MREGKPDPFGDLAGFWHPGPDGAGTWAVLFMGRTKHDILARHEARHDKFVVPAQHECEGRAVPRISAR